MSDYSDVMTDVRKEVDAELDTNLRLLTDAERLEWIAHVPKVLVNDFVHLYQRAFLINQVFAKHGKPASTKLEHWLDKQLILRASVDGKRTGELLQAMRIRSEAIDRDAQNYTPSAPIGEKPKRRLGF